MPSYAPLPNIELDPRTEAELVQAAAQRVYEASGATLNDFSAGSPIMALLEGQAFAQAEFLQFANQFPEAVLVEWIGPFLGAQRRTGAGATVELTITIAPRDEQFDVFPGYQASTDAALTNGQSVSFVTVEQLMIPPGESEGKVRAVSVFRGVGSNVPPNTIVRPATALSGVVSVTNEEAAAGGQDPELLSEVKERFFSLIRRRNPVSAEDWVDFFSDALGPGASVTVLPRRSERGTYLYGEPYENNPRKDSLTNYGGNYIRTNPSVAFFVLNPDGTSINSAQQSALQQLIKWSLPIEFLGFVYPMETSDVDFVLDLRYDPSKPYAQNLPQLSKIVRNNMFAIMTPNAVWPHDYQPSINDVEGALTTSFPPTLGVVNQYTDPDISSLKAYFSPEGIALQEFSQVTPEPFDAGFTIRQGDLITETTNVGINYYEVLQSFNPETNTKAYHVNVGDMDLEIIRELTGGEYSTGDVISDAGQLYVVLASFVYQAGQSIIELQNSGFLSQSKLFTPWEDPNEVYNPFDENGNYDPQLIAFADADTPYDTVWPSKPAGYPREVRPGAPIYVVNRVFAINQNTTNLGTVQNLEFVDNNTTTVNVLTPEITYAAGSFVRTKGQPELAPEVVKESEFYIDPQTGVETFYAKVLKGFEFTLEPSDSYYVAVNALVEEGYIEPVQVTPFVTTGNVATFADKPFRYEARFRMGEYMRYRPEGGYKAQELETCINQSRICDEITQNCRVLFAKKLPVPIYYVALKDFTPNTDNVQDLVDAELITEVSLFDTDYLLPIEGDISSANITAGLVADRQIVNVDDLTEGDTVLVVDLEGKARGIYAWDGSAWNFLSTGMPDYRDLFRFAPGDVASFRNVSEIRSYRAVKHVTPIMDLEVYYDNGVFVREKNVSETVKWIDPTYHYEDAVYSHVGSATYFYRITRSFTPPETRTVWNNTVVPSTARIEEIFGNTLKIVSFADCNEVIKARLKDKASTVKLGTCQLNLTSKSIGSQASTFVWESSENREIMPALSLSPNNSFQLGPVNYGDGTLAL